VGREQRIEVGPMSGESNVVFWLEQRGIEATRGRIDRVMTAAKASDRLLTEEDLNALARLD
jgi:2-isopropylmalate synthase